MKRIVFGMLNPSKAGWPEGDLTVTKLCGFTARITGHELGVIDGGAIFSPDRRYRYRLWRVLVSPNDDITVRFDVVNMYGLIATQQRDLWEHVSPVSHDGLGVANDWHVRDAVAEADLVIAAWGGLPRRPAVWVRELAVLNALRARHDVMCFGMTADGEPRHPSRLAYATPLELFRQKAGSGPDPAPTASPHPSPDQEAAAK